MSPTTIGLLRVLHIVAGVFWVGAAVFVAGFLGPALSAVGPAGGQIMTQLVRVRRLPVWMMTATGVTLLSGLALYWIDARVGGQAWLGSGPGRIFGVGGVLALAAGMLGMAVNAPTGRKLGALGATLAAAGRPPTGEEAATLEALQGRMARAAVIVATLLLLATAAMAVARYVS